MHKVMLKHQVFCISICAFNSGAKGLNNNTNPAMVF